MELIHEKRLIATRQRHLQMLDLAYLPLDLWNNGDLWKNGDLRKNGDLAHRQMFPQSRCGSERTS